MTISWRPAHFYRERLVAGLDEMYFMVVDLPLPACKAKSFEECFAI